MSFRCRGVNRIVFITPSHHPHGSDHQGVPPLSPSAIVGSSGPARLYADSPRYASVLPPPVGNQSRSATALASSERSLWSSLVMPGRLISTKANWKGYHDRLAGTSTARSSTGSKDRSEEHTS